MLLKNMGFEKSMIDPCLLMRDDDYGVVILCMYVDDALCVGDEMAITNAIEHLKKEFEIKEDGDLDEFSMQVRRQIQGTL